MKDIELPPLPDADVYTSTALIGYRYSYSAILMQAYARAAVDADRAQRVPEGLLYSMLEPRPLSYPLDDYHKAMSEGPLHYTWTDKPHRLVYDLIAAVRYYASTPAQPAPQPVERKPMTEQEGLALAASLGWKIDFGGIGKDALELIAAVERHHRIRE